MSNNAANIFQVDQISPHEFELFVDLFKKLSGIHIRPEKQSLIESRLRKRFLSLRVSPKEYYKIIQENPEELAQFVTALTTHKTDWFREPIHFRVLEKVLSEQKGKTTLNPFYCWSAACSTGEEVYSIAMTLNKFGLGPNDWRILGTDISSHCIEHAKMGVYNRNIVDQQVTEEDVKRYFLQNSKIEYKELFRFTSEFNRQIKFREFNLTESRLPIDLEFNVIFLRNVLIYFDKDTTTKIIVNLVKYLKPGGLLILGLSETIVNAESLGLKRLESSVYLK